MYTYLSINQLNKPVRKDKNCKSNYNYNKQLSDKHEDVKFDIKNTKRRGGE